MKNDTKNSVLDKILFPSVFVDRLSSGKLTLFLAVCALGLLNTLPIILSNNLLLLGSSALQNIANGLWLVSIILLNGILDATIFCVPMLTLASHLVHENDEKKGFEYLTILIKIYFLAHLPLKFIEYTQSLVEKYNNFGMSFLSSDNFIEGLSILLCAWFAFSITRSLRKFMGTEPKYDVSLVLVAFGWFNLVSYAFSFILLWVFKFFMANHF